MIGKLVENVLYENVYSAVQSSTEATLYNGSAITVSNNGIDVKGYDQVNFVINAGELVGSAALDVSIFESDTDNPSGATLVSGVNANQDSVNATFTQITSANDNALHLGALKNTKRYLWAQSYQNANTSSFSIQCAKLTNDAPTSQTVVFDIEY